LLNTYLERVALPIEVILPNTNITYTAPRVIKLILPTGDTITTYGPEPFVHERLDKPQPPREYNDGAPGASRNNALRAAASHTRNAYKDVRVVPRKFSPAMESMMGT
jgi:hypothetical protein